MLNIFNVNNHNGKTPVTPTAPGALEGAKTKVHSSGKYTDPTGEFSAGEFKTAVWYVKHKVALYKATVATLIGASVLLWGFSLWQWGDYFIFGYTADQILFRNLSSSVDYNGIHAHYSPQPIQAISTEVLPGGVDKQDLVADVVNLNDRFFVSFDYHFAAGGEKTPAQHAFLLPGENRPLVYFGLSGAYPSGVELVIENQKWQRISGHAVADAKAWQGERLNFTVSDFEFAAAPYSDKAHANIISFRLTNASPFGYANPEFYVGLFLQGTMVQIMPLKLADFQSLDAKDIDLRSFVPGLNVSDVQVFPIINVYDSAVFMKPAR